MARRYNRDSRGRFASGGGGGGSKRPAARGISRGTNRLTRDNSGRITSVGGDGATARGGRLRTASGKQRATQTARISGGRAAGTVTRSGARRTAAAAAAVKPAATKLQRSGRKSRIENLSTNQEMGRKGIVSMSPRAKSVRSAAVAERKAERVSRIAERQTGIVGRRQINRASNYNPDGTFNQSAANANQRRLKRSQQLQEKLRTAATGASIASNALSKRRSNQPTTRTAAAAAKPRQPKMSEILGGTLRALAQADARRIREVESITGQKLRVPSSTTTRATTAAPRTGRVTDALGSSLRRLAQSDARMARGMADIASAATPKLAGTKASKPALKPAKPTTRTAAAAVKPVRRQPLRGVNAAVASNPAGFKGLPVSLRSRSRAGAAYRAKVNQLGKSTAASRGFNEALARGQRGGVAQSAPRTVFRQGRMSQMTLSGKVEQVRGGRIRPVGTRSSSGAIKMDRPRKRRS